AVNHQCRNSRDRGSITPLRSGLRSVVTRIINGGARNRIGGVSQTAVQGRRPATAKTIGATAARTCRSGMKPQSTMAARLPAGTSNVRRAGGPLAGFAAAAAIRSADDASCIPVLDPIGRPPGSAPHPRVVRRQESALGILAPANRRKMNPGNGRMLVMCEMPVVIQPEPVNRSPDPEVACTLEDVTCGAKVMDVLHRRP